jgi:hypothetical protein
MASGVDTLVIPMLRVEARIGVPGGISLASGTDVTARDGGITLLVVTEFDEDDTFNGVEGDVLTGDCILVLTDAAGAFGVAVVLFCILTNLGCVDSVDLTIQHINNWSRKRWMTGLTRRRAVF